MSRPGFFAELKRRNVYKVAVAYAVVGWLVIQIASTILPTFHAPEWVVQTLVVIVALGFPVALVIAWAFEITPEGIKRTEDVLPNETVPRWSRRKFVALIVVLALVAAALLVFKLVGTSRWDVRSDNANDEGGRRSAASLPEKSIAVLPLVNQSGDATQEYFSDGLTEELINGLGQIPELRVIGRNSSFILRARVATRVRSDRHSGLLTWWKAAYGNTAINFGSLSSSSMSRMAPSAGRRLTTAS